VAGDGEIVGGARRVPPVGRGADGPRASIKGFRQGRTAGDLWQQGGALVVRPDGKVTYRYVSLGPGDHPPPAALVEALKRAA